ncbi:ABC transporter ATP-binding protein [Orientia tsutsugamushi]|nr:ABC transporter ATP-binding protein [Orientia tsutsugamushi]
MELLKFILKTSSTYKVLLLGMMSCMLVIAFDSNFRPYVIKLLIDGAHNFSIKTYIIWATVYLSSQMISVISAAAFDWLGTLYHTSYRERIAHRYLEQLSKYEYNFFQETLAGTLTAKVTDAFNSIPMVVFITMNMFLQFVFLIIIASIIFIKTSYLLGIIMLVWIAAFVTLTRRHIKNSTDYNKEYAQCRPKIFGFLTDYFTNILNVWFFSEVKNEKNRLRVITQDFIEKSLKFGIFLRKYYFSYGTLVTCYVALIFVILGYLSLQNEITPGDFAVIFMINYKIAEKLSEISYKLIEFTQQLAIATNAITLLNKQPKNDSKTNFIYKEGTIVFSGIDFAYIGTKEKILENFNLTIAAKQKVGLVGVSGSGKSTIINLITRLEEPNSSSVLIDNQNIANVSMESLRKHISIVSQDPSLFHRSIFDNIACAKHNSTKVEVIEAAKKAKIDDFIQSLPEKYDTLVGERGLKLSGGQRQRIAIARALLKNAPIFIMDEATSNLDSITEEVIKTTLTEFMQGKTALIVAHRLSTVVNMDRILVLDAGRIIQDGSHECLMQQDGIYAKFWGLHQF